MALSDQCEGAPRSGVVRQFQRRLDVEAFGLATDGFGGGT
jgi:hypothetical protein